MTILNPRLPSHINSFAEASVSFIVGKPLTAGREFTIRFKNEKGEDTTASVKFKELEDQFKALSKNSSDEENIKTIYIKLKEANQNADHALEKTSGWYQFKTSFHRLSNLFRKSHDEFLDHILSKKNYELPHLSTPWYEAIIKNLVNYKSLEKFSDQLLIEHGKSVKERYEALAKKHPGINIMGENLDGQRRKMLSFEMEGLALIGTYLKQKHELEHFYVCDSLEAFQQKIAEIYSSEEDIRASFVVPCIGMGKALAKFPENQHKVTVGLEKINGKTNIIYLDGDPRMSLDESNTMKSIHELTDLKAEPPVSAILWCLNKIKRDYADITFYNSMVKREHGDFGCETFALRDAVAFLKTPQFFKKIERHLQAENGSLIIEVTQLPPNFMKGTQSKSLLDNYIKTNPQASKEAIPRARSHARSLKKTLQANLALGFDKNGDLKQQNHYTSFRSLKYHLMALQAMEDLSTDQLKSIIAESFVYVDRPPLKEGEEPRTLHDLFTGAWKED